MQIRVIYKATCKYELDAKCYHLPVQEEEETRNQGTLSDSCAKHCDGGSCEVCWCLCGSLTWTFRPSHDHTPALVRRLAPEPGPGY